MPDDIAALIHRLIRDHPDAPSEILERIEDSTSAPLLVAAALLTADPDLLIRAAQHAITTRDRQLVSLADAHQRGNADLLDALVRDHLSEHPGNLLAAWIAGRRLPNPGLRQPQLGARPTTRRTSCQTSALQHHPPAPPYPEG